MLQRQAQASSDVWQNLFTQGEEEMTSIGKLGKLVCAGSLLLASLTAVGQSNADGIVTINGGRNALLLNTRPQKITLAAPASPGLVKIYSNLGTGKSVYNGKAGYGILGKDAGQMSPEKVACGFVPKADHIVTEIRVGASYFSGTNALVVSLNVNAKDHPGKALHTWYFTNLPKFGTCCTLQIAKYAKGIQVKKGTLYWVTLAPFAQHQDTYDIWDNNINNLQGPFSNNTGSGWQPRSLQLLTAFGVFGK
jgi:hypothetical protein